MWEYEAMLYHWNKTHSGGDEIQAPDPAEVQKRLDAINMDPRLTS